MSTSSKGSINIKSIRIRYQRINSLMQQYSLMIISGVMSFYSENPFSLSDTPAA